MVGNSTASLRTEIELQALCDSRQILKDLNGVAIQNILLSEADKAAYYILWWVSVTASRSWHPVTAPHFYGGIWWSAQQGVSDCPYYLLYLRSFY